MKIGFLGMGNMGTPMALRLAAAGHELSVWNRNEGRTKPLLREGAIAAGTPAEAELGADAVITMLFDDQAYEQVVFGSNGLLDALSPGGLHISCSTISVVMSQRLTREYAARGVDFVAAPVFGQANAATESGLMAVVAGAGHAIERAHPLLETFSRAINVVGSQPWEAHAFRLGGSFLLGAVTHALGEAFAFAAAEGLDPEAFFETVNAALFQSHGMSEMARNMFHPSDSSAMSDVGAKDLRLVREEAARHQIRLTLAEPIAQMYARARQVNTSQDV